MTKVGVDGAANDFAADFPKEFGFVGELDDFGGADECKVERIEKQQQVFVLKIMKGELLEGFLGTIPGLGFEKGCYFAYCSFDCCCCHI